MHIISTGKKWVIFGAIVIVIFGIGMIVVHYDKPSSASQENSATDAGAALSSTGENSVAAAVSTAPVSSSSPPAPPATSAEDETSITIHLLTPIANNVWTIGQPNPIAWDKAAGITGEIDLVNATTKQFIGVIDSNVGVLQTSYIWDARSIALARYSPDSKNVVPGVYSIRIHFDGNDLGDLVSGPITISN